MAKKIEVEDFGASLAADIKAIAQSLKNTKLNEDGLTILVAEAAGVNRTHARAVLRALQRLEGKYLK